MMSHRPTTLTEYQWYINCTACIILLHDLPAEILGAQHTLIRYTFSCPNELLEHCPLKIHCIAKSLNALIGNDRNLLYFVRQVCYLSRFTHSVSMALLYGAMCRLAKQPMGMFQVVKIRKILSICKVIDLDKIEDIIEDLHQFLLVLAQCLVLFRREPAAAAWDSDVVKELIGHIELIERTLERLYRQQPNTIKCLETIEVIKFDLLMIARISNV